jgi:hypothetical protein
MFGPPRLATTAVTVSWRRFLRRRRPARVSRTLTTLLRPARTEYLLRAITTDLTAAADALVVLRSRSRIVPEHFGVAVGGQATGKSTCLALECSTGAGAPAAGPGS